jgi:formylglycine-generating enzyme required for sulfatase activity
VLRGSSWNWIAADATTTARDDYAADYSSSDWYGFRCVRDYQPGDWNG